MPQSSPASGGLLSPRAVLPAAGQGADDEAQVAAESENQAPVEFKTRHRPSTLAARRRRAVKRLKSPSTRTSSPPRPRPSRSRSPSRRRSRETTVAEPAPDEEPKEEPSESSDDDSGNPNAGSKDWGAKKDTGGSDDSGPIDGSKAEQVLGWAEKGVGTPYVFGGTSQSGWDCSGYTSWVYSRIGVDLPRQSGAQKESGTVVSESEAKPGDLIWHPGHVGIYAGDGQMYDAGSPGSGTSKRSYSWMGDVTFIRVL